MSGVEKTKALLADAVVLSGKRMCEKFHTNNCFL